MVNILTGYKRTTRGSDVHVNSISNRLPKCLAVGGVKVEVIHCEKIDLVARCLMYGNSCYIAPHLLRKY